jgi:hypothetical protein
MAETSPPKKSRRGRNRCDRGLFVLEKAKGLAIGS